MQLTDEFDHADATPHILQVQWNPDSSNFRFIKPPHYSNQYSFPLDIKLLCNFTLDFLNFLIFQTNFRFPWRFKTERDSTVCQVCWETNFPNPSTRYHEKMGQALEEELGAESMQRHLSGSASRAGGRG